MWPYLHLSLLWAAQPLLFLLGAQGFLWPSQCWVLSSTWPSKDKYLSWERLEAKPIHSGSVLHGSFLFVLVLGLNSGLCTCWSPAWLFCRQPQPRAPGSWDVALAMEHEVGQRKEGSSRPITHKLQHCGRMWCQPPCRPAALRTWTGLAGLSSSPLSWLNGQQLQAHPSPLCFCAYQARLFYLYATETHQN
jgi:hypothetical protein